MSGICSAFCCWKSKDVTRYSPDSDVEEQAGYRAAPATESKSIPGQEKSRESYQSFTPPSSNRPMISRSVTPDSACAYGDGETYQGAVTAASPNKSKYGALSPHDYV